jgi:hypothetical protein
MNPPIFVPIVEGQGDVQAVPVLLRRLAERSERWNVRVNPPIRVKASSFMSEKDGDYFRRYIELAATKARQVGGLVVILLDCEDGCPAKVGPQLLARAQAVRSDVEFLVVLAYREYETWFIASVESLTDFAAASANPICPANPEAIRDAKGWLAENMKIIYDPVVHQATFSTHFDFDQAATISSFDRLQRKIQQYLAT